MSTKAEWLEGFEYVGKPPFMHQVRLRLKQSGVAAGVTEEQFDKVFEQLMGLVKGSPYHTDVWFATMASIAEGTLIYGRKEGQCPQPEPLTT